MATSPNRLEPFCDMRNRDSDQKLLLITLLEGFGKETADQYTYGVTSYPAGFFFFKRIRRPPRPPLFPYPTLSRSEPAGVEVLHPVHHPALAAHDPAPADEEHLEGGLQVVLGDPHGVEVLLPGEHHLLVLHGLPEMEEHTSELQSPCNLVCRLLLEK